MDKIIIHNTKNEFSAAIVKANANITYYVIKAISAYKNAYNAFYSRNTSNNSGIFNVKNVQKSLIDTRDVANIAFDNASSAYDCAYNAASAAYNYAYDSKSVSSIIRTAARVAARVAVTTAFNTFNAARIAANVAVIAAETKFAATYPVRNGCEHHRSYSVIYLSSLKQIMTNNEYYDTNFIARFTKTFDSAYTDAITAIEATSTIADTETNLTAKTVKYATKTTTSTAKVTWKVADIPITPPADPIYVLTEADLKIALETALQKFNKMNEKKHTLQELFNNTSEYIDKLNNAREWIYTNCPDNNETHSILLKTDHDDLSGEHYY